MNSKDIGPQTLSVRLFSDGQHHTTSGGGRGALQAGGGPTGGRGPYRRAGGPNGGGVVWRGDWFSVS